MTSGLTLKRAGLSKVEAHNKEWMTVMREWAEYYSNLHGQVSSEDLQALVTAGTMPPPHHPNAWGAIFRGSEWALVGRKKSTRASAHAREIKIWRHI